MKVLKTVHIKASGEYDILIGNGLLEACGELVSKVSKPCKAALVTDSNVDALYSEKVAESLEKSGFETVKYVFEAGEESKNAETFIDILEFFAKNELTRTDIAVALGGGVVGDITGFAAAAYLRGIKFVQIPTTLLAAVDSSVGGKTAIDLKAGKNLAGAFHQPSLVICDTDAFKTLPERQVACGYAEVIKYAVLFDEDFFCALENGLEPIEETVDRCVRFKRDIVEQDELDFGARKLLNLGHTAAHGIERESRYELNHGEAVAVGTVIAARVSEKLGICEKGVSQRICGVLKKYGLPRECEFTAKQLADAALNDKKRETDAITLVLPEKIGRCILKKVPVNDLERLFKMGLVAD